MRHLENHVRVHNLYTHEGSTRYVVEWKMSLLKYVIPSSCKCHRVHGARDRPVAGPAGGGAG